MTEIDADFGAEIPLDSVISELVTFLHKLYNPKRESILDDCV